MTGKRRSGSKRVARSAIVMAIAAVALLAPPVPAQPVKASYAYTLSSFTGAIPYNWSRVAVDRERNEVYVLYESTVRIFNDAGMEVYRFGDDLDLGLMIDVAVDDRGDVLLLVYRDSKMAIVRCDYRGRPQSEITLKGLPVEFAEFAPNRMLFKGGNLYLASTLGLQLVQTDRDGNFKKGHDLFRLFELEEKDRGNVEVSGLSVDHDGNVLMTVAVLFRAFILSPDGRLAAFGKPGSAPGSFNIMGGIARDSKGNLLIVDKLKGSVLVFNPKFVFLTQFSTRGHKPGQLAYPDDLVIDGRDRVYVTQMARKGVSVFNLAYTGGGRM